MTLASGKTVMPALQRGKLATTRPLHTITSSRTTKGREDHQLSSLQILADLVTEPNSKRHIAPSSDLQDR